MIVYAIAMDDTETIRHWHIIPMADRQFYVEPPSHEGGYSLLLADEETWTIENHSDGRKYAIGRNDFKEIFA
jgi:hypothetical protein